MQDDLVARVATKTDRQGHAQLSASRFVHKPSLQTRTQHMQLRLAHRALHAQQQAVVEIGGVVQAVFVKDQRIGERADFQQAVPIAGVTRQTRHLKPQYNSRLAHPHITYQTLKPFAVGGRAGLTEIGIDDDDAVVRPTALFNVCVFAGGVQTAFPNLVTGTQINKQKIKAWLEPLNTSDDWSKSNAYGIKTLGAGGANHSEDMRIGKFAEPIKKGGNIYGNHYKQGEKWFRSTMIAMQQQADTIFLLTNDWRYQRVALSKTMDSEDWIKNTSAGRKWAENLVKAKKLYAEENKKRIAAGQPPKVLTGRWSLVHTYFPNTPGMPGPEWHYFEPKDFVEAFLLTRGKHEPSSIQLQSGLKKKRVKLIFHLM